MGSWNDPNLRNHIKDDSTLTIGKFLETFSFKAEPSSAKTYPYKLKDVYKTHDIIYKALNSEKFVKYADRLRDLSKEYESFAETSNCKPMKDSYYTYNKSAQLYQFLLITNSLWSSMDYTSDIGTVKIPSKEILTDMLRDILIGNNYRNMKILLTESDIRDAIQKSSSAEIEYDLVDIISEKMYIDSEDITKRMNSPLIKEYLSSKLVQMTGSKEENEEVLNEILNELMMKLHQYIKETSSEVA